MEYGYFLFIFTYELNILYKDRHSSTIYSFFYLYFGGGATPDDRIASTIHATVLTYAVWKHIYSHPKLLGGFFLIARSLSVVHQT